MRGLIVILCAFLTLVVPSPVHAALGDTGILHAEVLEVVSERMENIPGTQTDALVQILNARLETGEVVSVYNDRVELGVGDSFYANYQELVEGLRYGVQDADRRSMVLLAVLIFACITVLVGGWVGVRALASLAAAGVLIIFGLVPLLTAGAPPVLTSAAGAAVILAVAMLLTHGWNRTTGAAYLSSLVTIVVAICLGSFFVWAAHLTGFTDDTSTILNLSTGNTLHMDGLLLGALIIGVLGIIDDISITQVLTVKELRSANGSLSASELYKRAMHVGQEHLGAVVNTLVLAYAGASLPLLLFFTIAPADPWFLINSEVIAVEIIRATVGGAALALVVPIATYLGIHFSKSVA